VNKETHLHLSLASKLLTTNLILASTSSPFLYRKAWKRLERKSSSSSIGEKTRLARRKSRVRSDLSVGVYSVFWSRGFSGLRDRRLRFSAAFHERRERDENGGEEGNVLKSRTEKSLFFLNRSRPRLQYLRHNSRFKFRTRIGEPCPDFLTDGDGSFGEEADREGNNVLEDGEVGL
jgi:hypothetical protein